MASSVLLLLFKLFFTGGCQVQCSNSLFHVHTATRIFPRVFKSINFYYSSSSKPNFIMDGAKIEITIPIYSSLIINAFQSNCNQLLQ